MVNTSFAWHLSTSNNNGHWDYSLSWTSGDIAALPALIGDCTHSNSPADFSVVLNTSTQDMSDPPLDSNNSVQDQNIVPLNQFSTSGTFGSDPFQYGDTVARFSIVYENANQDCDNQIAVSPNFLIENLPFESDFPLSNGKPVTITPSADTWIKKDYPNENEGLSNILRLKSTGKNRALLKFDQAQIQAAIGNSNLSNATLRLTITNNGNNWSASGRTISLHRFMTDWTEGNGFINGAISPNRGTGQGATWGCAVDANIRNTLTDCITNWDMLNSTSWPFNNSVTSVNNISNNQTGTIDFDVTSDVSNFLNNSSNNFGWILKKEDESLSGEVSFGSRESITPPQLIITTQN